MFCYIQTTWSEILQVSPDSQVGLLHHHVTTRFQQHLVSNLPGGYLTCEPAVNSILIDAQSISWILCSALRFASARKTFRLCDPSIGAGHLALRAEPLGKVGVSRPTGYRGGLALRGAWSPKRGGRKHVLTPNM